MRVAVIGCGYVSAFYAATFPNHPQLELAGVFDRISEHADAFSRHFGVRQYMTLADVLGDPSVDAVANLTNPHSHFEISRDALLAGKHVYSEKPLAMKLDDAEQLVTLARQRGLQLCSAPCNLLGETAQTMWRALHENKIGKVRLVYAELDDGLIHRLAYEQWVNEFGRPWPYQDEFEVGCTLEHAGYYVSWLVAFFGPIQRLTTFPAILVPDKQTRLPVHAMAPDFSCACLEFQSGVVARLTCGIVAPHDHRLQIFGDEGTLSTEDGWYYDSPVYFEPFSTLSTRMKKLPLAARLRGVHRRRLPLVRSPKTSFTYRTGGHRMDFARGIAEMADAIDQGRDSRLSGDFSLHINEAVLKLQTPVAGNATQTMQTTVGECSPMPWALREPRTPSTSTADERAASRVVDAFAS